MNVLFDYFRIVGNAEEIPPAFSASSRGPETGLGDITADFPEGDFSAEAHVTP